MWTASDRERYGRAGLRYPSDLTDAEWALISPLIRPGKRGGRRRSVDVREVLNGLLYVLETGCQWRYLPRDLPPRSTVHGYRQRWDWHGTLEAVHHQLYVACRDRRAKRPVPLRPSLTASRSRRRKRGAVGRPGWLRRREEGQRGQVPRPRRHAGFAAEHRRARGQPAGPQRCGARARSPHPGPVPLPPHHLRRCRIPGTTCGQCGAAQWPMAAAYCASRRRHARLRRVAQAVDC